MNIKRLSMSLSIAMLLGSALPASAVTPIQLTNNMHEDANPRIYKEHVVWNRWDGNDWEIFYHNLITGETRQITDNDSDDVMPDTDGKRIAWIPEHVDWHPFIEFYDLSTGITFGFDEVYQELLSRFSWYVTNRSYPLLGPRVKGDKLLFGFGDHVWVAGFIDEYPGSVADPESLGMTLGYSGFNGEAVDLDYKFLDDGSFVSMEALRGRLTLVIT